MATTNWRNILCSFFTIMVASLCYSQSGQPRDLVTVRLSVVGQGIAQGLGNEKYRKECFFALATVTNIQDTAIEFFTSTCSWPISNWKTDSKKVYLYLPGCDAQQFERITLLPKQTIEFNVALSFLDKKSSVDSVKLGFIYCTAVLDLLDRNNPKLPVFWSNEAQLINTLNTYQIRK
jgi:hypothetical protein